MIKRLTDNEFHTKESKERACYIQEPRLQAIYEKLFELEDIEEELGIDLVTLFKALEQNYVYVKTNVGIEKNKGFNLCGLELWSQVKLNAKDYGKTWALTKKEKKK